MLNTKKKTNQSISSVVLAGVSGCSHYVSHANLRSHLSDTSHESSILLKLIQPDSHGRDWTDRGMSLVLFHSISAPVCLAVHTEAAGEQA